MLVRQKLDIPENKTLNCVLFDYYSNRHRLGREVSFIFPSVLYMHYLE